MHSASSRTSCAIRSAATYARDGGKLARIHAGSIAAAAWPQRYRYRLFLVTDAKLSERSKSIETSDLDGIPVDYHIWDISRLHQIHESKQGREELDIDLTEWLKEGLPALEISQAEDFSTYLAAVPGGLIADLYERYGSRLLESNVRWYP